MALDDQIISAESGGNPAAKNPNSSATGPGQFIDSTWLSMIGRYRPDLAQGRSPDQILAMRSDPALSRQMTSAYAQENAQTLQNAGLPVNPGTIYLAHFAGPQGAVGLLSADPSAPASSVLTPAAVKANPFLKGMTVGDVRDWASRKMGGNSSATAGPTGAPGTSAVAPAGASSPSSPVAPAGMLSDLQNGGQEPQPSPLAGIPGLLAQMQQGDVPQVPNLPPIQMAPAPGLMQARLQQVMANPLLRQRVLAGMLQGASQT